MEDSAHTNDTGRSSYTHSDVPVDDELSLPRATVYKMIMEMLPTGVGCSKETRDLLVDCCNEFVHLISSEANDICEKGGRKTISPEHVMEALKSLGFTDYLEQVQAAHDEHQTQNKEKERIRANSKAEMAKLSEEELLKQQEELFQQARIKYQQQMAATSSGNAGVAPNATIGNAASVANAQIVMTDQPAEVKKGSSTESLELSD